jgi:anionic cell wall polymer biosynthesis LytR-Cps2A-Psr (LCP) family protein
MSEAVADRRMSRRRWYLRLLFVPLVALLAAFTTTVIWFLVAYKQLAADLNASQERIPTAVFTALAPAGEAIDEPQVTLAAGTTGNRRGTAALAFRTDPDKRQMVLLSLPTLSEDVSDAALIQTTSRLIGAPINHVVLVSPPSLGRIVDEIGPVTIANPSPVDFTFDNGRYWHFPAGPIALDGPHAVAFMNGHGETPTVIREQLILERLVDRLLAPATISDLSAATRSIARSADTDLSTSDLVGLAWVRFHSDSLVRCHRTRGPGGEASVTPAERRLFLGETTLAGGQSAKGCRATALNEGSLPLPPKQLIKAIGVAYPLWRIGLAVLLGILVLMVLFFARGRLWSALRALVGQLRSLGRVRRGPAVARPTPSDQPSVERGRRPSLGDVRVLFARIRVPSRPHLRRDEWSGPARSPVHRFSMVGRNIRERGMPAWAMRNRGDIGLYVLVTALAAVITFLILISAG